MKRPFASLWLSWLLACLFITAPALAQKADSDAKSADAKSIEEDYELLQVFVDTLDQVERNYVTELSRKELVEAAIEGVIRKLDPYSTYIKPDDLDQFRTSVESRFGGIGIQVRLDGDNLTVISPLAGAPAYKAGVQAGDVIVEIEGESAEGISLEEAVKKLKGKPGTSVKITVKHSNDERQEMELTREIVEMETVHGFQRSTGDEWDFMLDKQHKIGYISISSFSRHTFRDLAAAIETLTRQGMRGLVLDLRFNPGGLLSSAIDICDLFISDGRIVSTAGRNVREQVWDAKKPGTYEDFPMAILVNRYSASASEIVSACLQDHKRAVVIGERTWGKGSVQNIIDLSGGDRSGALKLTTAAYKRPSGKNIHRHQGDKDDDEWGVIPNDGYRLRLEDNELVELTRLQRDRDIIRPTLEAVEAAQDSEAPKEEKQEGEKPADKEDKPKEDKPKADKPQDDSTSEEPKPEEGEEASKDEEAEAEPKEFVDRQLQRALKYLHEELNKAQAEKTTEEPKAKAG